MTMATETKKRLKTEMLSIRMSEDTLRWLEEIAERKGVNTSTMARMLLLERMSQEGSPAGSPTRRSLTVTRTRESRRWAARACSLRGC